jgi:aspartate/methionine/tyrosine aminotransferase
VSAARRSQPDLIDLTETNPTAVGLTYPASLLAAMATRESLTYRPDPCGLLSTREFIAEMTERKVPAHQIVLASSTSEVYGWLFKLLCDPGDEVLVPVPSYPLFDVLTGLEAVRARPYRLETHSGWALDRRSLTAQLTPRTRALLVVSPNNPTGSLLHDDDREWLVGMAHERQLAIISDEVFSDYVIRPGALTRSLAGESRALTFTLGGLSKSVGLPQVKLAWMLVSGPGDRLEEAITRLEIVADSYLSVSTPVQVAAPYLLREGGMVREQIRQRLLINLAQLRDMARECPAISVMEPEGGWSVVIRVPDIGDEEALVARALRDARVLVHPGYFFDFVEGRFVVLSLLPTPSDFGEGVRRLVPVIDQVTRG